MSTAESGEGAVFYIMIGKVLPPNVRALANKLLNAADHLLLLSLHCYHGAQTQ